jgi:hypothetical protein
MKCYSKPRALRTVAQFVCSTVELGDLTMLEKCSHEERGIRECCST